jgi:hypothetical protein
MVAKMQLNSARALAKCTIEALFIQNRLFAASCCTNNFSEPIPLLLAVS